MTSRMIPYTGGSGTLTVGATIAAASAASGKAAGLYATRASAPVLTGVAAGWLHVTDWNATAYPTSGTFTEGGFTYTISGPAVADFVAVRERLLAAICTATGGVYRVPTPEDERDLPLTFVQDSTDDVETDYDFTRLVMPVAVARAELATSTDRAAQRAQAHAMLAELVASMYTDETFGALAQGISLSGQGIQTELGKYVFAEASFQVRYQHVRGDPTATEIEADPEPEPV